MFSGKMGGAGRNFFSELSRIVIKEGRISASILSTVRRTLITASVKISAALEVVRGLRREIDESGCIAVSRLISVLESRVTALLGIGGKRDSSSRIRPFNFSGGPCIVVIIKIGKIKGAAAVNGLTDELRTRKGGIIINTTSAFHTTTISRLII